MYLPNCVLMSILLMIADAVSGSDKPISAYDGEDVTLNCSVDSHITQEHIEEVSWIRTDGNILVLLYQNNEALPDSSHERYRDRVEFFTDEIPKGNFSLRLKSVRTEDKGVYMCQVFAGGLSANTTVVLERLGFSVSHIMVLILCISAFGSALLLCCLIYCRSPNKDTVFHLQMFLVFCPNILMFLAFVLWGVSEGTLNETIFCCVHYLLRPLMLLWSAPYAHDFTGTIGAVVLYYSFRTQYVVFSAVFYAVIFKYVLDKGLNYTGLDGFMITALFVIVLLLYLFYIIFIFAKFIDKLSERGFVMFSALAGISFNVLPSFQFILLYYTFGTTRGVFYIVAFLPVFLTVTNYSWDFTCGTDMGCSPLVTRSLWVVFMFLVNSVMVYFYIIALETEKDRIGWACMIAFLQVLWAVLNFTWSFKWDIHRVVSIYLFGSVGVVLLNSVTLITELILKSVNGYRTVGDLRIIVFSSEFFFPLCLLILMVFEPWIKTYLQSRQNAAGSDETPASGSGQNQNTAESHELNPLLIQDQEAGRSVVTMENQLDLVESQT